MAKKYGHRLKPLYILDILRRKSDEAHPITAAVICKELENYGITAERKSVYSDIAALEEYGYDIIKSANPKGWFWVQESLRNPKFICLPTP